MFCFIYYFERYPALGLPLDYGNLLINDGFEDLDTLLVLLSYAQTSYVFIPPCLSLFSLLASPTVKHSDGNRPRVI